MMEYMLLNNKNKQNIRSEINKGFDFEWENPNLMNEIIKKIDNIYPSSSDPKDFQKDSKSLYNINKLFSNLYDRKIDNDEFLKKIKKELNLLHKKYPDLNNYKFKFETYDSIINKSHRLLINGCAGIGKSYFIYKLGEELTKIKVPHLCIYGKYNKDISKRIFDEIVNITSEFYLIIDAFNEFDETKQVEIIEKIKKISKKKNVNIIITYRNFTLKEEIISCIEEINCKKYEFKGVDFESSLLTMIESYGIESMKYLDVIESNNPLYIIMLNKILKSDKLKNENVNGIAQITYIMEYYIKELCGKRNWIIVKEIGKKMLETEKPYITEEELKIISEENYNSFVKKMSENDFMYISKIDKEKTFWFTIHELSDYIIARPLFNIISEKSEKEIIEIVNNKIKKISSISEAITIMLFEKYKENNLKMAINVFSKSNLYHNIDLSFLKKIRFNENQIKEIQTSIKIKEISYAYFLLAGFPNRPFNCTNYINQVLFDNKDYQINIIERFREYDYIIHLKNIVYSLPFVENQMDIINEYFYYSFWLMSSSNERIKNLSIKIVYDLSYKKKELRKKLIIYYKKVNDYYIKKGIIHILTKLPKDKYTIKFLKRVYKSKKELDAENIYRIAKFFNKEHNTPIIHKKNLYKTLPKNTVVDERFDLSRIINVADLYEKYLLKFERYPSEKNTISLNKNFIINKSNSIKKYNRKLNKKFDCIKDSGYCKYSVFSEMIRDNMYNINIKKVDSKRMFLVYQGIFKDIAKKYRYDYLKEERFDIHINPFENSMLKKILLISQDILLGSLMTNYYTEEFSIFNDDITLGYKSFSYIDYNEEKIYLTTPISPYNELIDKLNNLKCEEIGLYEQRNYDWFKDVQISKNVCSILMKEIKYKNESWSLIGGCIHKFIPNELNESYSCYMGINPKHYLDGFENSNELTIINKDYYGNIYDYKNEIYHKNMNIHSFQSNSLDIKESYMVFPPPELVKILKLHYDSKLSSWNDDNNNIIILCDNNQKKYYEYPMSGAVYIKTSVLNNLKRNNTIVYWCYTEKLFGKYGWNQDASLHIQLDCNGNIDRIYNNYHLKNKKQETNEKCEKCKFGIYSKNNEKSLEDLEKMLETYKKSEL